MQVLPTALRVDLTGGVRDGTVGLSGCGVCALNKIFFSVHAGAADGAAGGPDGGRARRLGRGVWVWCLRPDFFLVHTGAADSAAGGPDGGRARRRGGGRGRGAGPDGRGAGAAGVQHQGRHRAPVGRRRCAVHVWI